MNGAFQIDAFQNDSFQTSGSIPTPTIFGGGYSYAEKKKHDDDEVIMFMLEKGML
jgi:hypothetical protein